ncbi:class I SAM-dependent methyltransferase [Luteimonas gilva]|uniref:Class I SAM-dependent methyltransferase n=1 Tax=Luteimonas gilva TaxID=2572684 RepID=A0A4U5JPM1_9GAMM|nr:class I SAM-dependent methyltransferase [Luteimonas gilva]TKR29807.1 class I SAM-dependent methyltransferase [Luteimonas gilva]
MFSVLRTAWARWSALLRFSDSQEYWRQRYRRGGDSGAGSSGVPAEYKAGVLNAFVARHSVSSVIEFGSGDGRQLERAAYPRYLGVDISRDAVQACSRRFAGDPSKRFVVLDEYGGQRADLALSLDVVFHLVEDDVYDDYLGRLFAAAERYVIIYSTDENRSGAMKHVRDRKVTEDVALRFPGFARMTEEESSSPPPVEFNRGLATTFFFYERRESAGAGRGEILPG